MSILNWNLNKFENFIIGRSQKNLGILQISLAFKLERREDANNLLLEFAELSPNEKVKFRLEEMLETVYGYFDLERNETTSRYWFFLKLEGIILAVYSTKIGYLDESEIEDCKNILLLNSF